MAKEINTYSAGVIGIAPAASCTDIATLHGDGTRRIRVQRVIVSGIATASDSTPIALVMRSTKATGGTAVAMTAVPHAAYQPASIATVNNYTANPTVGTIIGIVQTARLILAKAAATGAGTVLVFNFDGDERVLILSSSTAQLAVSLNGGTVPSGAAIDVSFTWTEESIP